MISTIRVEFKRIFEKKNTIVCFLLITASLFFTLLGIWDYNVCFEDKRDFFTTEKNKIKLYMNYEQYGVAGFRVMLEPSALVVFFNRSDFVRNIEANIDTSEVVKVYNGRKGQRAFFVDGRFGDLNQLVAIFGTLIMMIMGFLTFPNRYIIDFLGKRYYIKTIVSRLLILDIFFSLFFVITYSFAAIWGITFSSSENRVFLFYGMLAILLLNFFYVGGVLIKTLFKYKKSAVTFLLISWFALIFILPEAGKILRTNDVSQVPSVEKLNLEKLHVLLKAERQGMKYLRQTLAQKSKQDTEKLKEIAKELFKNYMNKGYTKNTQNEAVFLQQVKQAIDTFTSRFPFSPIDFLNFVSGEASGKGYNGYLDFLNYALKLRHKFIQFYGQKRYEVTESQQPPPESFIKKSENIYQSQGRLPGTFGTGAAVITIYNAILLVVLFYLNRKKKVKGESPTIPTDIKRNNMLFLLVNKDKQGHLFETLKQKNYSTLNPVSQSVIYKELTAEGFINFVCREKKIKKDKVTANLEKLNIWEADLQKNLADYTVEDKKKLICSIVFAEADSEGRDIIINDFIKGVSNAFEKQFLSLVSREIAAGRRIVYISSQMYSPASSFMKRDMEVKNYQPFQLDPQKISLR